MKLFILLVVVVLERSWTALARWCADRGVQKRVLSLRQRLSAVLGESLALLVVWFVPPLILAWFLAWFLAWIDADQGSLLGVLLYLVVSIATLLLLVAPGQAHKKAKALAQACQQEDAEHAAQCRAQLWRDGADPIEQADSIEEASPQQLAERIITLGFNEWFAVLFWFVVLGPAGALFYRLTDWFAQPPPIINSAVNSGANTTANAGAINESLPSPHAQTGSFIDALPARLLALLDWPIARLYAFLLLLAGGFNRGLDAWLNGPIKNDLSLAEKNADLIGRVGHASLELEREDDCAEGAVCLADQSSWYKNASAIVLRALMIGLGIVALFTLSGWLR
jgi:AmpE protein